MLQVGCLNFTTGAIIILLLTGMLGLFLVIGRLHLPLIADLTMMAPK